MKLYKKGAIVGKFMPPHNGHISLITFGSLMCEELIVLVDNLPNDIEKIPLSIRVDILKEAFKNVSNVTIKSIPYITPQIPDTPGFWQTWKDIFITEANPDVIIGSENYILRLADIIKCNHLLYDIERTNTNISATKIRNNLVKNWNFLPKASQKYLRRKIAIIGGESCGKTTLSKQLANHFNSQFSKEFALNLISTSDKLTFKDMELILHSQYAQNLSLLSDSGPIFVSDTEAITTKIWSKFLFNKYPTSSQWFIDNQDFDKYILLEPVLEWKSDIHRLAPNHRDWFHNQFLLELNNNNKKYTTLNNPQTFLQDSITITHDLFRYTT